MNCAAREAHNYLLRGPPWPSLLVRVKRLLLLDSVHRNCP
jgi:hypothetical protein